jgi:hypothetical protein
MKPVEIVLRREEEGRGRMMKGGSLAKIHRKCICKYTMFPLFNYYMLIKFAYANSIICANIVKHEVIMLSEISQTH